MPTRLPRRPPPLQELLERCGGLQETLSLLVRLATTSAGDRYLHWDELRHRPPPEGLSHEQWWLAEKLSRRATPLLGLLIAGKDSRREIFRVPEGLAARLPG